MSGALIKYGTISKLDLEKGLFQVYFPDDEIETKPISMLNPLTNSTKFWAPPSQGDHVVCLMDCHCEEGVILGQVYTKKTSPNEDLNASDVFGVRFSDGTIIKYDADSGLLTVNAGTKDIYVKCENATMEVGNTFTVQGELHVDGDIQCDADIKANGNVIAGAAIPATHTTLQGHVHVIPSGSSAAPTPGT